MVEERYSPFQLIPDRNKSNTGSQGFTFKRCLVRSERVSESDLHVTNPLELHLFPTGS